MYCIVSTYKFPIDIYSTINVGFNIIQITMTSSNNQSTNGKLKCNREHFIMYLHNIYISYYTDTYVATGSNSQKFKYIAS